MSWTLYNLRFQACSPLRLGAGTMGFIQLTRAYVPGRALWGAITANLTRLDTPATSKHYRDIGAEVNQNTRLFYLYPCLDMDPLPAKLDPDQQRRLISSSAQTAIQPGNQAAEDASLHETEFIRHQVVDQDGEGWRPVYWVGHLAVRQGWSREDQLWAAMKTLSLGGDRRYGMGQVVLDERIAATKGAKIFAHGECNPDDGTVTWPAEKPFRAHVRIAKLEAPVTGSLEPLVGRVWLEDRGSGQGLSPADICWAPGSWVEAEQCFDVRDHGVWSARPCEGKITRK